MCIYCVSGVFSMRNAFPKRWLETPWVMSSRVMSSKSLVEMTNKVSPWCRVCSSKAVSASCWRLVCSISPTNTNNKEQLCVHSHHHATCILHTNIIQPTHTNQQHTLTQHHRTLRLPSQTWRRAQEEVCPWMHCRTWHVCPRLGHCQEGWGWVARNHWQVRSPPPRSQESQQDQEAIRINTNYSFYCCVALFLCVCF